MSSTTIDRPASSRLARITGGLYLGYIFVTVLADVVGHIGMGTPAEAYSAMTTDAGAFQLALVFALVSGLLFVLAAWGLYGLLRRADPDMALLFLVLNAVGVAIQTASLLSLVSAIQLGNAADHLQAYSAGQLEGLAYLAINTYKTSFVAAQLFFGAWLFPLGYLVYRSGLLPRILGALLVADGVAVLIWFGQALLLPDYRAITYPGLVVSFVAEIGLTLWLLVRGVKVEPGTSGQVSRAPSLA